MVRGSTWNIWDFHLHSPYSVLNNQFGDPKSEDTWEQYVSAIEARAGESGIAAIGVTDYFMIDGYKRLRAMQETGRLANILLFPNIEFRVDKIIYRSKGGADPMRLNFHVLFSPELPIALIEEHFLHDLDFIHQNEPFASANKHKLKTANLETFGNTLIRQQASFAGTSALQIGCTHAIVSLDEIKKRLEEDGRFAGKYLLILADNDLGKIDWAGQDHGTRKHLIQMSHGVFSSNTGSKEFYLGKRHDHPEQFLDEFRSFKPCIWGCDSHGLNQRFLTPDEERYCWIKGEVSWEGLKQILYEPEHRVRIQRDNPEPQKSFYTLDSVHVTGTRVADTLSVSELKINLNPNLVTIIGGRGSGKTALLDLIGSCFREGQKLQKIDSSFFRRLYSDKNRRTAKPEPIPVSLRFRSGEEFEKNVGGEDTIFEQADVLYLTQNHMDEYTADPSKLYDHIVELIFENDSDGRSRYSSLEEEADTLLRTIEAINLQMDQLRKEVIEKMPDEQKQRMQTQGELADFQKRLAEQQAQQAGSGEEITQLTTHLRDLKSQRDQMIALKNLLNTTSRRIEEFHRQYGIDAQAINAQISALADSVRLVTVPAEISTLTVVADTLSSDFALLEKAQPGSEAQITEVEAKLNKLDGIDRTISQLQRNINELESSIKEIDERIAQLETKQQRIQELDSQRVQTFADLMVKTVEQRIFLQDAIDRFGTAQDDLISGLSFTAQVDTSVRHTYIERITDKINLRSHSIEWVDSSLQTLIDKVDSQLNSAVPLEDHKSQNTFLPLARSFSDWGTDIRLKGSNTRSDFYNALLRPFFRIGLHIEFNGRPLDALSMGERAVVLLKILLGLDDKPLLIDQPEEHLDNRYIYDELTPAFRKAKCKRQIIIATHNANLVVNTDAEQILIAEHKDGEISYRVGTLEDLEIRESIKTILEGGDQAFKKREEKYGYRF